MTFRLLLLIIVNVATLSSLVHATEYENCVVLDSANNYKLFWTLVQDDIHFAVSATPTSTNDPWIAIGFSKSESEAMISNGDCSDIYITSYSSAGCSDSPLNSTCTNNCQFCYHDLSVCDKPTTSSYSFVDSVDAEQNFFPTNITKNQNSFSFEFTRKLNTGDSKDVTIATTSQVVIWAIGEKSGRNYLKHRADTRGQKTISFSAKSFCNETVEEDDKFTFTSPSGDYTASWTITSDLAFIEVEVEAKTSGWAAFGYGADDLMPNTDVVVAYFDSSNNFVIFDGYLTGYSPPTPDESNDITNYQGEKNGEILKFKFTKALQTNDQKDHKLKSGETSYLFFAMGQLSNSNSILKHSQKGSSQTDFFGGKTSQSSQENTLKKVHGSLMIISWIALMGTGIVSVHKLKHKVAVWFNSHVAFQVTGGVLTLVAFIIIFVDIGSMTNSPHSIIGVVIFAVMLLQVLLGMAGHFSITLRKSVDLMHRILGSLVYPLAFVNIFLGIYSLGGTIEMYIIVALCFIAFAIVYLIPYKNDKKSEEIAMENQGEESLQKEIPRPVLLSIVSYGIISSVLVIILIILLFVRIPSGATSENTLSLETKQIDVRFSNFSLPKKQTSYMCQSFKAEGSSQRDAIRLIPIVDNAKVVHHMILFKTDTFLASSTPVWDCAKMPNGVPIWIWAAGGGDFILPPEVGQRYGPKEIQNMVLQIHYDMSYTTDYANSDERDGSGVRIVFSDSLQKHQMGIVRLGVPISKISLPPQRNEVALSGECPSSATRGLKNPLYVFSTALHMHFLGKKIYVKQSRDGQEIATVASVDKWDFNNQQFIASNATLRGGDSLVTTCVWDTSEQTKVVLGGEDSVKEMCFAFLFFYPRVKGDPQSCGA